MTMAERWLLSADEEQADVPLIASASVIRYYLSDQKF